MQKAFVALGCFGSGQGGGVPPRFGDHPWTGAAKIMATSYIVYGEPIFQVTVSCESRFRQAKDHIPDRALGLRIVQTSWV